jgi:uncharacterized protein
MKMSARFEKKLNKILLDIEYYECIKDLFNSDPVKLMNSFIQHGSTTTLEHSINVSYKSYKLAKLLKMDYKSAARAGLLHDLFLYDWHLEPKDNKLFQKHGFTHPEKALNNANKYFDLNDKEKDIISKHMWPLTLRKVPKYKESFLVSVVDKYSSCSETINPVLDKVSEYLI